MRVSLLMTGLGAGLAVAVAAGFTAPAARAQTAEVHQ